MPWDAALPGNATADVAIKRVMRCEVSRVRGKHHVTLYMDLSAFLRTHRAPRANPSSP